MATLAHGPTGSNGEKAQFATTVQFTDALLTAADLALTAAPEAQARIRRGLSLVEADAVTDMQHLRERWFTVRSARNAETVYDIESNGHTTCTCPSFAQHGHEPGFYCKHIYSVLLIRKARQLWHPEPRMKHAYHMESGEEGHARVFGNGSARFHPGGHRHSFICQQSELRIGPYIHTFGRPY